MRRESCIDMFGRGCEKFCYASTPAALLPETSPTIN